MEKAVCWELVATRKGITRVRVIVAGQYLLTQVASPGNQRPRWTVEDCGSPSVASQRSISVTDHVEREHSARLSVPPTEVIVHDAELEALEQGGRIPPGLRARAYTCFSRAKAP